MKNEYITPELKKRLIERETKTIESLVREHSKYMIFMARKFGIKRDLEHDVIQNTWITFIEKVENFEGRSKVRTFLTGILFNKCREIKRSENKHISESYSTSEDVYDILWNNKFDSTGHWISVPEAPETFSLKAEMATIIGSCIDSLPEHQRIVFSLKELQGISNAEISQMLKQSISNVGVLLFRAKNKLRDCISIASEK